MTKITGGCLCGAVRYTSDAEPAFVAVCHCVTCQKYTGSAYSINVGLPGESVTITGSSHATYEDRSGSSGKPFLRTFCSRCGSPISGRGDAYSGLIFLKAGTLDDPSQVKPAIHIWCSEKLPWVVIEDGAGQNPGNP
jgi:hypothetical protein